MPEQEIVSNAIVEKLIALGVDTFFIQPGSQILPLVDYLDSVNLENKIGVVSEANGTVMADVYGRIKKKPAVVLVTAGPGSTNCITPVAQALNCSSPLIHLSATLPDDAPVDAFHGTNDPFFLERIFENVTKASYRISDVESLDEKIEDAFNLTVSPRCGPVHIGVVDKLLEKPYVRSVVRAANLKGRSTTWDCKLEQLQTVLSIINSSEFPILYAGKGVDRALAENEIVELQHCLNAGVITPRHYPDAFPNDHVGFLGSVGQYSHPAAILAVSKADVAISIGIAPGTLEDRWLVNNFKGKVVYIDEVKSDKIGLYGEIRYVIQTLVQLLPKISNEQRTRRSQIIQEGKKLMNEINSKIDDEVSKYSQNGCNFIHPATLVKAIFKCVGKSGYVIGDAGLAGGAWINDLFLNRSVGHFLHSRNFDSMGFAIPGSIGAKLASPDSSVFGVTGDGSFLSCMGDLSVAVKHQISPVIVVFNDSAFGMIRAEQKERSSRFLATDLPDISFCQLSRSLGAEAYFVKNAREIEQIFQETRDTGKPIVIEAKTDWNVFPPSWKFWGR